MEDEQRKPPKHFASSINKKRPKPSKEEALGSIKAYLSELIAVPCCHDSHYRPTKCTCVHNNLSEAWIPFVAERLYDFHVIQSAEQRKMFLFEAIKISQQKNSNSKLPVPAIGKPADASLFSICHHSFLRLMNVGKGKYTTLLAQAKSNIVEPHGLAGKKSNNSLDPIVEAKLETFFEDMSRMASPRATRLVRMEIGVDLRDADEELQELPSYFTGRHLYRRFCEELGYKAGLKDAKGGLKLTKIVGFDGDQHRPCCRATFELYWRKHYPKLVIPNAREDICNDCFILSHSFRFWTTRAARREAEGRADDGADERVNDYENQEKAVDLAKLHVERAAAQRKYFNNMSILASGLVYIVLVMDFMQNEGLPYLGSEQSGATHYYSPLTINTFGIYNMETEKLHAFSYNEGEGAKGGNNVASMMCEYLKIYNMLLASINPFRILKIVMDNCSGQNKNRMVLRMALYLVEKGCFKEVEFVFLIVGHTKNPCDRMFNLLKKGHRNSNVYTMDQLLGKFNENDHTTAAHFTDHRDWDEHLDGLYKRFDPGTTKNYHNFVVDFEESPTKMRIHVSKLEKDQNLSRSKEFGKTGVDAALRSTKLDELPQPIPPPGIPAIKQIELGTKWRPHVPPDYQDEICPIPPAEMIEKQKKEKNEKVKRKKKQKEQQKKKRKRTNQQQDTSADDAAAVEEEQEQSQEEQQQQQAYEYQQALMLQQQQQQVMMGYQAQCYPTLHPLLHPHNFPCM